MTRCFQVETQIENISDILFIIILLIFYLSYLNPQILPRRPAHLQRLRVRVRGGHDTLLPGQHPWAAVGVAGAAQRRAAWRQLVIRHWQRHLQGGPSDITMLLLLFTCVYHMCAGELEADATER